MQKTRSFGRNKYVKRNFGSGGRFVSSNSFNFKRRPARRKLGEDIDINKFIQKASADVHEEEIKIINTFLSFNFNKPLKNNLDKRNYVTPTPIQDQAIEHILAGRDLIGLANTGTGKTAAFLLPLIEKIFKDRTQNVLIIVPTRELATQVENEFHQFSWGMKIFSAVCVGGTSMSKQITNLRRRPNLVVGTPGRLKDLTDRGILKLNFFQNVVLDEVDRMLDMGFIRDIKNLLQKLPDKRQSLFFSATIPAQIQSLVREFSKDPITIAVKVGETKKNVEQDIIKVLDKSMKFNQLQDLLKKGGVDKTLIFVETKREVERITKNLISNGLKANSIHGDKKQSQRQAALNLFKNNSINILVATDVAARGLDIKNVTHVINYTVPQTYTDYIHRIGRTGRHTNKGFAYTFVE